MAAEGYIQGALSQLQSALDDLRRQMDMVRQQADGQKRQFQQHIAELERTIKAEDVALLKQHDAVQQEVFLDARHHTKGEIDEVKAQMVQIDAQTNTTVQRKTKAQSDLQAIMQQLNGFLGSPLLH